MGSIDRLEIKQLRLFLRKNNGLLPTPVAEKLSRNVVISAPCFSIVPLYLETTDAIDAIDAIAFLPSRALVDSNLLALNLAEKPMSFDVIASWHPRSSDDPLHNWVLAFL